MRGRFKFISRTWDRLHSSFWFLPSVMALSAMATAILLVMLDALEAAWLGWIDEWTYAFGPESARACCATIRMRFPVNLDETPLWVCGEGRA